MKVPDPHRWLVSYADFMTLLCVFFVLLYTIQKVDDETGSGIKNALEGIFTVPLTDSNPLSRLLPLPEQGNGLLPLLTNIQHIAQFIPAADDIHIEGDVDWITVSLNADFLFAAGETRIRDDALPFIKALADDLKTYPFPINVQGHADDTPVKGRTNWELSALRAASVVQNLALYGVAPQRMAAVGLSYYHPLVDGDSAADKAANRRVVIYMTQQDEALWTRPDNRF